MQRLFLGPLLATALIVPSLTAASTWNIDSAHSSAQFAVRHLMVSTVRGNLGTVSGVVTLDESDITKSTVEATIDAAGIDTRDAKRDDHLRSPDFLDTAKYPTITFKSTKVEQVTPTSYKVTGDLSMHGVTKPVVLTVEGSPKPIADPFGKTRMGGSATTTITRQDFGINWSKSLDGGGLVVGNDVDVTIDLEVTQQK
ncbi:MAG: YceI family protein [Candidatus Binatia bacterium]